MTNNFNILVNKINAFRFKFYTYKILKGIIQLLLILILIVTLLSVLEYYIYLSSEFRKYTFIGFVLFASLFFVQFVLLPGLRLFKVLQPISIEKSSLIIQQHFSDIKDKLLNVIELNSLQESNYSNDIVLASIDQKISELKVFDFRNAIHFKDLKYITVYFVVSILISATLYLLNQNIFIESGHRYVHYNQTFIKPAPYQFILLNDTLTSKKGEEFKLNIKCEGQQIPEILYVNIEGENYLMSQVKTGYFEFQIASVINPLSFYFTDQKYNSKTYHLKLLPNPGINNFEVEILPPAYTGVEKQIINNVGDIQVPNGSHILWSFQGVDIDSLYIHIFDSVKLVSNVVNNYYKVQNQFFNSSDYKVFIANKLTKPELALSYKLDIIEDFFPEIKIVQLKDSTLLTRYFFKGIINDDYGFNKLNFHFNINNTDSVISIPVLKNLLNQDFYFSFDFSSIPNNTEIITYYFSVTDNDAINNFKTTTSESFEFHMPDKEEITEEDQQQFEQIESLAEESRKLVDEIQSDLKNLQIKNMDTNVSDWEKSQMINEIVNKQNKLQQLYEQLKNDNENLNNYLNAFNNQNNEIIDKQRQIEELLNEVFTDELKELMEEFNKLAEEFNSKRFNELSQQMDLTFEDLQKQLDRNLEMLRRMKVEQKLQSVIDDVNNLAENQKKLAEDIIEEKKFEESISSVEKDESEFERINEELRNALNLNNELKKPLNFDDFDEELEEIKKEFKISNEELNKNNRKKSGSSLNKNSDNMKNLAFGMQQMLNSNIMEQNFENIENLRQILSNLMLLSFSQETILEGLESLEQGDPLFKELNQQQSRLQKQSEIVRDSLYALATRTPQISNMVNTEIVSMQMYLDKAAEQLEEAMFGNARMSQQFIITSLNNLALLLNEALENLEQQMANAQPGDQQCENPGNNPGGMNSLKNASENIKQQLEQMIEQMKNGGMPMNQQMGESLMQHEMMQQMLRDIMNNGSVGETAKNQLQEIDKLLEENRKQLMNKSIDANTVIRQNLITTRLLEAEKAEMEREFEDKRESETADEFYSNPVKYFEYNQKHNFSIEYLNKNVHQLNNFYNKKYKQYLNNIDKKSDL